MTNTGTEQQLAARTVARHSGSSRDVGSERCPARGRNCRRCAGLRLDRRWYLDVCWLRWLGSRRGDRHGLCLRQRHRDHEAERVDELAAAGRAHAAFALPALGKRHARAESIDLRGHVDMHARRRRTRFTGEARDFDVEAREVARIAVHIDVHAIGGRRACAQQRDNDDRSDHAAHVALSTVLHVQRELVKRNWRALQPARRGSSARTTARKERPACASYAAARYGRCTRAPLRMSAKQERKQ